MSVVESERGLERLFPIWDDTMTRKVHPFVLPELLGGPCDAAFLTLDLGECGEAIDALLNAS